MLAELAILASTCAPEIHIDTLKAVLKHESSFHQYAIGINRGKRLDQQPQTLNEAVEIVEDLIERKIDFDAGLGQINVRNWEWLGLTPTTVFDPCTNLKAAQTVLKDCYVRATKRFEQGQTALLAAFSCYNTGNFERGFSNGYVRKVLAAANIVVPAIDKDSIRALSSGGSTAQTRPAQERDSGNPTAAASTTPDAFSQTRPDAFAQRRMDAFAQPRSDAFHRAVTPRSPVGSIRYHPR